MDIQKLARMARIQLSEEEQKQLAKDLEGIIAYCQKLETLDVDNLEPLVHVFEQPDNTWGEDIPDVDGINNCLAQNAPHMEADQLSVPKIL